MASNSKVNRIAGLSLAAAVAGTLTLVPVAKAETTSPSSESTTSKAPVVSTEDTSSAAPATSSTAAPVTTSVKSAEGTTKASTSNVAPTTKADTAQEWADILKGFASLIVSATAAGSGTSGVQYTSDDHTYSAVASNPTNGRLYAVSDEGHLLRIHPQTGNLKDLGEIPGVDAKKITSAAFTKDGTLVLFDGETVYTKDLADDETGPKSKPENLEFVKKPIEGVRDLPELAWAPTDNDAELVALAVKDGEATRYTLNVKDAKAAADEAPAEVDKGVDLDDVAAFEYAYLADDATFFADGEGNAVKLEDGKIVDVETDRTDEDNYKAVAGLEAKPESTAGETPASGEPTTTAADAPAGADTATVTPTITAEPTPSKKAPSVGQRDAEVVELDVEVVTADGGLVRDASFVSADGTVDGATDESGKGKVSLKLDEASRGKDTFNLAIDQAPENWGVAVAEVQRGAKSVKFVLPEGKDASTTTTVAAPKNTPSSTTTKTAAQGDDGLIEVDVLVKTADDKLVEGAEFKSEDGRVFGTTDANGRGKVTIDPKKDNAKLVQLTLKEAPKGYKNADVVIRRGDTEAELVLPRDPNATPSSTLSKPDQVLKVLDQVRPVASSFLAPAAALAGAGGLAGAAGAGGSKSTKSTNTTFGGTKVTSSSTTGRSTGRSTSVTPSAKVVTRNGNSTKVAKANTSTRATSSDKDTERDGDLADTGTPMRAIIALGVLSVLIGGAYLALGRRRENQ